MDQFNKQKNILCGEKIKSLRKEAGLTQEQLAEMIDVNAKLISKYENGKTFPKNETIKKLCELFRVNPFYLLGKSNKKELSHSAGYHTTSQRYFFLNNFGYVVHFGMVYKDYYPSDPKEVFYDDWRRVYIVDGSSDGVYVLHNKKHETIVRDVEIKQVSIRKMTSDNYEEWEEHIISFKEFQSRLTQIEQIIDVIINAENIL
ncbi:MAG: helix-turn-helix transcriptional regulator [Oscillospiraceae bacterium]|nr:helix-turn-helix transcriptional regulator [Oscillospiraceae bacterium]